MRGVKLILFFIGFSVCINAWAQLSTNEKPVSFGRESEIRVCQRSAIPSVIMPQQDRARTARIESMRKESSKLALFGYVHNVSYNLTNSGTWYSLSNGDKLWKLNVTCPESKAVYFTYDKFWLPEGGKFFVYSKDKKQTLGAFTSRNNKGDRWNLRGFATGVVNGSDIVLDYYQPKNIETEAVISINCIVRGYTPPSGDYGFNKSGGCQVNVNCDEGYYWKGEHRAVARILMKGTAQDNELDTLAWYCSGSLITTTFQHGEPFLLTADHCLPRNKDAIVYSYDNNRNILDDALFYWNYEMPGCENVMLEPFIYSTTGAIIVSNYNYSADFALLRLTEDPNELANYLPYYLGWDNSGQPGDAGVCIHHPKGDVKKVSIVAGEIISTLAGSYQRDDYWGDHWKVTWADGTTEEGSSGSPLFNANHKLIGQLHGGYSSCGDSIHAPDWYGKFSKSWLGLNDVFHRKELKYWLDPSGDNTEIMEGLLYVSKTFAITDNECIYGNVLVTGTGQLTIQSNIEMEGNGTLTVESGGKLIIDGGKLSNAKLDLKPNTTLYIINGGIIETRSGFSAPMGVKVEISYGRII